MSALYTENFVQSSFEHKYLTFSSFPSVIFKLDFIHSSYIEISEVYRMALKCFVSYGHGIQHSA